ncbi:MAG TPA: hypothetical protein VJO16_10500 [Candidatus Acidoferrum sp.]|nr:hypothetical protein [Candidatus Acidoferrum sp.]
MSKRLKQVLLAGLLFLGVLPALASGQNPPPSKKPVPAGPPAPQSTHYPILILAFGNEPNWSVRIGQKGPERMDRPGYPPIPLEPAEVTHEAAADSWTYHAKDSATGVAVAVHLSREACTDAKNDTITATPAPSGKYSFRVSVDHAQVGTLKGCARIAAELFPRINNQPDEEEDADKKKPPAPTITNFKAPVAVAYMNSAGAVILSRGTVKRTVAPEGTELALSHDGKKLLYTRSDSKTGPERTIVLYDFDSAKSLDLLQGYVRQAFWSPDNSHIAFLKAQDKAWQVWTFPAGNPETATLYSPQPVSSLDGWIDNHTILATDMLNAYWLSDETLPQAVALRDIYGPAFQVMSSDTIRVSPINPDLLLVSADYLSAPTGAPVDSMGLAAGVFLYEVRSKRRSTLCPPEQWGRAAEWSRDSLQVFFNGMDSSHRQIVNRIFWDGTSLQRTLVGSSYVVGQ